ncbi:MAG: hypothetical protein QGF09_11145 [Rhodospirillales bacterium]|jgi:hemerythrin|nr:hypothetical protein [Rhodospirillales bacterium]
MTSRIEQFLEPPEKGTESHTYEELLDFLENWLTGHIMVVDRAYAPSMKDVEIPPETG